MQSLRETQLCHYHYDALDRLIANALQNMPQHQRFYCKSRLATEIQGVNRYSLLQHGDQLLAQQQTTSGALSTTLLATDHQRSVLQTLRDNQPPHLITYSPYGHRQAGSGLNSVFGFNGERRDPVTGYYLLGNGYRAFNPVLMRFNSPDSWSPFREGGINAYGYCQGNPTTNSDPTGHVISNTVATGLKNSLNRARERLAVPSGNPGDMVHQPYQFTRAGDPSSYSSSSRVVNKGTVTEFSYPSGLTRAVINNRERSLYQSSINALPVKNIQHALNTPGELPPVLQKKLLALVNQLEEVNYYNHVGRSNIKSQNTINDPFKLKRDLIVQALNGEAPGVTPATAKSILFRTGQYNPHMSAAAEKFHRDLYEELFNVRNGRHPTDQ